MNCDKIAKGGCICKDTLLMKNTTMTGAATANPREAALFVAPAIINAVRAMTPLTSA